MQYKHYGSDSQLFLTVAHFHFENIQCSNSQSIAQLQLENAIFCVFSGDLKKNKVSARYTATFCKLFDDFREYGAHGANTTFSNQNAPMAHLRAGPQLGEGQKGAAPL